MCTVYESISRTNVILFKVSVQGGLMVYLNTYISINVHPK